MPVSPGKKQRALSPEEFEFLAERHEALAQEVQDGFVQQGRLLTLAEAEDLRGHLADAETYRRNAAELRGSA